MQSFINTVVDKTELTPLSTPAQVILACGRYLILIGLPMLLITLMIMFNVKHYKQRKPCFWFVLTTWVVLLLGVFLQYAVTPFYVPFKHGMIKHIPYKIEHNYNPQVSPNFRYKMVFFSPKANDLDIFNDRGIDVLYSNKVPHVNGHYKIKYKKHWRVIDQIK